LRTFLLIFSRFFNVTHPFGDGQGRHSNEQVE
jgi:fido (protein-threonine AMPylation protein)